MRSLLDQQARSVHGGDPDLLELADKRLERGGIAFGGKPHDRCPLKEEAHGIHRPLVIFAPRLHDAPIILVTKDRPTLSWAAVPESYPRLTTAHFQTMIGADRDGALRIHDGQAVGELGLTEIDGGKQIFRDGIGPEQPMAR
jgi:hypothetical protein